MWCAVVQRPVWQALALQDLTHLSQGSPSERWRRAAIFDDESGESWSTVVQHCLGEVCLLQYCTPMVQRTNSALYPSAHMQEPICCVQRFRIFCTHMMAVLMFDLRDTLYADRVARAVVGIV